MYIHRSYIDMFITDIVHQSQGTYGFCIIYPSLIVAYRIVIKSFNLEDFFSAMLDPDMRIRRAYFRELR